MTPQEARIVRRSRSGERVLIIAGDEREAARIRNGLRDAGAQLPNVTIVALSILDETFVRDRDLTSVEVTSWAYQVAGREYGNRLARCLDLCQRRGIRRAVRPS